MHTGWLAMAYEVQWNEDRIFSAAAEKEIGGVTFTNKIYLCFFRKSEYWTRAKNINQKQSI